MAGQTLTSKSASIPFKKNGGGLNSTFGHLNLQNNESSSLLNIDFDRSGSFLKRNGYSRLNTSAFNSGAAWTSLHWFESTTDFLIGTCGNKLAKMDSLDGTWDDITGALTITAGQDNQFRWSTFLNTALGTNGVDVPVIWTGSGNGSAMTVPTGLTTAKFLTIYNSYTFLANVTVSGTAHPTRIYWSAINSISSWNTADFNDVERNDGQDITGLKRLGSKLIIFKDRSIHQAIFTGDTDVPFVFEQTPSTVGCNAGGSIQEVENGLVFESQDGYYFFDGNNSYKISDRVTTTLETFSKNRNQYTASAYQKSKNRYWSSQTTSGSTAHNQCMIWDSFNNAFSLYEGHNANCFAIVYTSGEERIYFGDYLGYVYRADTGSNDNPAGTETAIEAYYYTKWFDYDDIVNQKETPEVKIYFQSNNATLTFTYSYDLEDADTYSSTFSMAAGSSLYGTAIYDTNTYAGSGGAVTRRDLTGRGHLIRLGFKNNTVSETFRIDGFGALANIDTNV